MKLITKTNKTLKELTKKQPENIIVLVDSIFYGYRVTKYNNFISMVVDKNKFTIIKAENNNEAIDLVNKWILRDNQYLVVA